MDRGAELTTLFGRIDALVTKDDSLDMDELKQVFGEHADEFIKYCDGQGEAGAVDAKLTFEEFKTGILADTKDMSDDDFKTNWIDRMTGCVEAAEAAEGATPATPQPTTVGERLQAAIQERLQKAKMEAEAKAAAAAKEAPVEEPPQAEDEDEPKIGREGASVPIEDRVAPLGRAVLRLPRGHAASPGVRPPARESAARQGLHLGDLITHLHLLRLGHLLELLLPLFLEPAGGRPGEDADEDRLDDHAEKDAYEVQSKLPKKRYQIP